MTPDLLICWYALGWVACGVDVALSAQHERNPVARLLLLGPIMLAIFPFAVLGAAFLRLQPKFDTSKQYLWRKR